MTVSDAVSAADEINAEIENLRVLMSQFKPKLT
jgi:hypothetical protein